MAVLVASLPAALLLLLLATTGTATSTTSPETTDAPTEPATTPAPTPAPLNGACNNSTGCNDSNAECSSGTCRCMAGYFDSSGDCAAASSVAPANLTVTARGVGSLTLAWEAPSLSSSSASVSGYLIQWTGGGDTTDAGTSHQVTGLSPNVQYTFQVVARISYNNRTETSGRSNTVTGKPLSTEGEACSVDGDCGNNTNLVCNMTAQVCRCRSGYFWRSDSSVCVAASSVAPANLQVTDRGVDFLNFSWTALSLGSSSASVSGYEIQRIGGGNTSVGAPSVTGQVTGLSPNMSYTFQVVAKISYNKRMETSGRSNTVTGLTLSTEGQACSVNEDCGTNTNLVCEAARECRCPSGYFWRSDDSVCFAASSVAPASLQVTRGVGSLTLTWSALSLGSSASVSGYQVQWGGGGNTTNVGTSLTHQVTGLSPNVQYTFQVKARISYNNRTETSGSSNTVTSKPLSTEGQACSVNEDCGTNTNLVCEAARECRCQSGYFWRSNSSACVLASSVAPGNLRVTARGVGSLTLTWSAPSLGNSASVSGYLVQWTGGGGGDTTDVGASLSYNVTDLSPNVQYTFQVVANISYNGRTETSGNSTVEDAALSTENQNCSVDGDCGNNTNLVCDMTAQVCRCRSGYFWSDSSACVLAASAVPGGLSIIRGVTFLAVTWSAPTGVSGLSLLYQVSWGGAGSPQNTSNTSYNITGLTSDKEYTVSVKTLIDYGDRTEMSNDTSQSNRTRVAYRGTCSSSSSECFDSDASCYAASGPRQCVCDEGFFWNSASCTAISQLVPSTVSVEGEVGTEWLTVSWIQSEYSSFVTSYVLTTSPASTSTVVQRGSSSTRVTGLVPGGNYTVTINAHILADLRNQTISSRMMSSTRTLKPETPGGLVEGKSRLTETSAELVFHGVERGYANSYLVTLGNQRPKTVTDSSNNPYVRAQLNVRFDSLDRGTKYTLTITAQSSGVKGEPYSADITTPTSVPATVGAVIGGLAAAGLLIALVVFILYKRKLGPWSKSHGSGSDVIIPDLPKQDIAKKRPVKLKDFNQHVYDMHKDSNLRFSEEFEDLTSISPKHPKEVGSREEYKLKNRYVNILPFDHSRVKLLPLSEDESSDYINANYLPGYNMVREYIACQGPLTNTVPDFWRMMWEQKCNVIVCLSDLMEKGRAKVDQYWPAEVNSPETYGEIQVEMTSTSTLNKYIIRVFKMSLGDEERMVKQFFLPGWEDFSANLTPDDVIEFIKMVRLERKPNDPGPMVVHCSAGVGRTGTFIALDVVQQFIRDKDLESRLDIFALVLRMRENREYMVQTEKQYIFIHDTTKEILDRKIKAQQEMDHIYGNDDNIYENQGFSNDADIYVNMENGKPTTQL